MQTVKLALAALCVAATLAAGECKEAKEVKKSGSKFASKLVHSDPDDPEMKKLLQDILNYTKCPDKTPCKPVDFILSVETSQVKQQIYFKIEYVTTPYEKKWILRSDCKIIFALQSPPPGTEDDQIKFLHCKSYRPMPPTPVLNKLSELPDSISLKIPLPQLN